MAAYLTPDGREIPMQAMRYLQRKFIVLDGPEGCGKSTQIRMLSDRLAREQVPTAVVRDPGTTRIGEQIRAILLNPDNHDMAMRCEMMLYMAARAQLMKEHIIPAIEAGKCVICDRFVSSTLAYQLGGDGMTEQEIRQTADIAIAGRWPDLTIILDIPPEKSFLRIQRAKDRLEQRPMEYHQRVYANYLAQAKSAPAHYRVVDAQQAPEAVHAAIVAALGSLH
jgi:dTMP kinase